MSKYVIPPFERSSLAVAGGAGRFPIRRVFCIGRNYPWPVAGGNGVGTGQRPAAISTSASTPASAPIQIPALDREPPFFFMKPADAVVPAEGQVAYPPQTNDFCHEIEMVVAIGKDGEDIVPDQALEHVWGYAAGMDLTRREIQAQAKQKGQPWEGAKAFDASAPSTALVPASETGHPEAGAIWLNVNGVERQRGDLADLIWPVKDLISFLSHSVVLKAGDLIFTGTPYGVGALQPGDVVEGGVDGVGQFTLTIGAR